VAKADRKNTAVVLNLDDPDELTRRPTSSFLNLETELANLASADHRTIEEIATAETHIAKAEARIKDICNRAYPSASGFSELFIHLLRNRWRSSAATVEYDQERNRLLLQLRKAFPAAKEHRRQRSEVTSNRDMIMAKEFLQKRESPSYKGKSDSDLKAGIGKDPRFQLKRSASIEAINRGRKFLVP
jgi:chromosome segregation ATPase